MTLLKHFKKWHFTLEACISEIVKFLQWEYSCISEIEKFLLLEYFIFKTIFICLYTPWGGGGGGLGELFCFNKPQGK